MVTYQFGTITPQVISYVGGKRKVIKKRRHRSGPKKKSAAAALRSLRAREAAAAKAAAEKAAGERAASEKTGKPETIEVTAEAERAAKAAVEQERQRVTSINTAVRSAGLAADFAAELIEAGHEVAKARALIIVKLAENQG